jgi:hypothetical protein
LDLFIFNSFDSVIFILDLLSLFVSLGSENSLVFFLSELFECSLIRLLLDFFELSEIISLFSEVLSLIPLYKLSSTIFSIFLLLLFSVFSLFSSIFLILLFAF